jgi:DNA-binding Lrp family transcriptional regulator
MGKRKIVATSQAAYHSLDPARLKADYKKIVDALTVIGEGNYEAIAKQAGRPEEKIWKRLKESCDKGLIHNTGKTVMTKNNRMSYVFAIGPSPEPVKKRQRVLKGPSVQDFSKAINQVKQSLKTQEELF